jgi:hypothetical protein
MYMWSYTTINLLLPHKTQGRGLAVRLGDHTKHLVIVEIIAC